MWNVEIAIRAWTSGWAKCSMFIMCDNKAVISVVNLGVTRDNALAAMAKDIWLRTAAYNIYLFTYLPIYLPIYLFTNLFIYPFFNS